MWSLNTFWGGFLMVRYELYFYSRIKPWIKPCKQYQNKPKLNIRCDHTPIRYNMNFHFILRWFPYGSLRVVCLCNKIELRIKTSSKQYLNKPKFDIWCALTPNRQNIKLQFFFSYGSLLRVVFLRQNWMILQISTNPYLSFFLIYWYD
jgi:hypothetical protein